MNIAENVDCMEAMKKLPDKAFDLAVVDPPYFSGPERRGYYGCRVSKIGVHRDYHDCHGAGYLGPIWTPGRYLGKPGLRDVFYCGDITPPPQRPGDGEFESNQRVCKVLRFGRSACFTSDISPISYVLVHRESEGRHAQNDVDAGITQIHRYILPIRR